MAERATIRTIQIDPTVTNDQLNAELTELKKFISEQQANCYDKSNSVEKKQECAKAAGDTQKKVLLIENELSRRRQIQLSLKRGGNKRKTTKGRRKNKSRRNRKSRR